MGRSLAQSEPVAQSSDSSEAAEEDSSPAQSDFESEADLESVEDLASDDASDELHTPDADAEIDADSSDEESLDVLPEGDFSSGSAVAEKDAALSPSLPQTRSRSRSRDAALDDDDDADDDAAEDDSPPPRRAGKRGAASQDQNGLHEYLSRLADSESRIHRHLLRHVREVHGIAEVAATAVRRGGTIWVTGEAELDPVARLLAGGFFVQGDKPLRSGVYEDPPDGAENGAPQPVPGDLLLAIALGGSPEFMGRIERAQQAGLFVAVIRSVTVNTIQHDGDIELALPVRGFRWISSAAITAGRVINRLARGLLVEQEKAGELIEVICPGCAETVLVEEEYAGRRGICPFCRTVFDIPKKGGELPSDDSEEAIGGGGERRIANKFRPSDCSVAVGVDGPPDESLEARPLVDLHPGGLELVTKANDVAGLETIVEGSEVWLRLEVPAFLEPIRTRGTVVRRSDVAAEGAVRIEVEFEDADGSVRAKLERIEIARTA